MNDDIIAIKKTILICDNSGNLSGRDSEKRANYGGLSSYVDMCPGDSSVVYHCFLTWLLNMSHFQYNPIQFKNMTHQSVNSSTRSFVMHYWQHTHTHTHTNNTIN